VKVADADFGGGVRVSTVIATIAAGPLVKARKQKEGKVSI
jgi:hypothetical protein